MNMYNNLLVLGMKDLFGVTTNTCVIEECVNRGNNPIAIMDQNSMEESLDYYGVCDIHYEELMKQYYKNEDKVVDENLLLA